MPIHLQNLVKMSGTSPIGGAGSYTLGSASSGFLAVSLADGESAYFEADDGSSNREVFKGTYTASGTTVSRDICLDSTNSGAFVSWGSALAVTIRIVGTAESNMPGFPGYVSGRMYASMQEFNGTSGANTLIPVNRLFLLFFPIFELVVAVKIACIVSVVGSAGAVARMGIYDNFKGRPGNLLVDAGTVGTASSAVEKQVTISQLVKPPGVWLACCVNSTTTQTSLRLLNPGWAHEIYDGLLAANDTYIVTNPGLIANDGTDYSAGLPSSATMKAATFTDAGATSQGAPMLRLGF